MENIAVIARDYRDFVDFIKDKRDDNFLYVHVWYLDDIRGLYFNNLIVTKNCPYNQKTEYLIEQCELRIRRQ